MSIQSLIIYYNSDDCANQFNKEEMERLGEVNLVVAGLIDLLISNHTITTQLGGSTCFYCGCETDLGTEHSEDCIVGQCEEVMEYIQDWE